MLPAPRLTGMRAFLLVWAGQLVSLLGTSMTTFGLTIWAFEQTGRATELALIGVCYAVPQLVMTPIAGLLVDRLSRKRLMMVSDLASGMVTIGIFFLFSAGRLEIPHLYLSATIQGAFQAFQWPAYSAAIASMLPKAQYTRANSLMSLAGPSSQIFAPLLAGALLGVIGLRGILLIDITTFLAALAALALIVVPPPTPSEAGATSRTNLWQEISFGFRYILRRPSLMGVQSLFLVGNFVFNVAMVLLAPMILSRTGNDEGTLAAVQTAGAIGGVVGGLIVGAWGGFQRRIVGVIAGWLIVFVGLGVVGLGSPALGAIGLAIWLGGMAVAMSSSPLIDGSNQAIWQAKIPQDVQGRVFSARLVIAWGVTPLANLVAGPLADQIMEPAMRPGGTLAGTFGGLVGTGPGAGMSLIFILAGIVGTLAIVGFALIPAVRQIETRLPDYDQASAGVVLESLPAD